MKRVVEGVGSAVLLLTAAALLASALVDAGHVSLAGVGVGGGLALVGVAAVTVDDWRAFENPSGGRFERRDVADVLAVTVAAGLTYVVSVHAGFGPVLASAAVGAAAAVGTPDVDAAAYCGSFVGMASPAVFPSAGPVFAAGLVAGGAFVVAKESFVGYGGKLGTLALFGCVTTGLVTGVEYAAAGAIPWESAALTVPTAAVAAVLTAVLSVRYDLGAVLGSALVGLAAGLALPVVVPASGGLLATVAFCASFVGMSAPERLGREGGIGLAGALCGLVFVVVTPAFAGAGGKLGTTAFISCVVLACVDRLFAAAGDRGSTSA